MHHLPGVPPCKHCGGHLRARVFDASGRVDVRKRYPNGQRATHATSVPLFKGYTLEDEKAGLTAPPAIVCPTCDAPDERYTIGQVGRYIDEYCIFEGIGPEQPESD